MCAVRKASKMHKTKVKVHKAAAAKHQMAAHKGTVAHGHKGGGSG